MLFWTVRWAMHHAGHATNPTLITQVAQWSDVLALPKVLCSVVLNKSTGITCLPLVLTDYLVPRYFPWNPNSTTAICQFTKWKNFIKFTDKFVSIPYRSLHRESRPFNFFLVNPHWPQGTNKPPWFSRKKATLLFAKVYIFCSTRSLCCWVVFLTA